MNRAPIGIFDSGIGGLTVARADLSIACPRESTVYFGDTARVPYGPKSPETVRRYSLEILHWLLEQGVKAVVIACNTSTAHALDDAAGGVAGAGDRRDRARRRARPRPRRRRGPIGVIGTAGTIASNAYARAIQRSRPEARVEQRACPLFVPLVEEGWFDHPAAELIARRVPRAAACRRRGHAGAGLHPLSAAQAAAAAGDGRRSAPDRQRRGDRGRRGVGCSAATGSRRRPMRRRRIGLR